MTRFTKARVKVFAMKKDVKVACILNMNRFLPSKRLLSTATVATVHKPRDSSELSHGHIAVTGSPALQRQKIWPETSETSETLSSERSKAHGNELCTAPPAATCRPFTAIFAFQTTWNFKPFQAIQLSPVETYGSEAPGRVQFETSRRQTRKNDTSLLKRFKYQWSTMIHIIKINIYIYT